MKHILLIPLTILLLLSCSEQKQPSTLHDTDYSSFYVERYGDTRILHTDGDCTCLCNHRTFGVVVAVINQLEAVEGSYKYCAHCIPRHIISHIQDLKSSNNP